MPNHGTKASSSVGDRMSDDPIDVWLRFLDDEEESEAEANTYMTETGYRVDWYLTAVGLVTSVPFDTLAEAYDWLEREGFANYGSGKEA